MKGPADEDLQLEKSDFIISGNPQLTIGKMSHLLDCLMHVPLYQNEQVEAEVSGTIAEDLPRFRAAVNLLVARYGHKERRQQGLELIFGIHVWRCCQL